jgi:hypothetical protein
LTPPIDVEVSPCWLHNHATTRWTGQSAESRGVRPRGLCAFTVTFSLFASFQNSGCIAICKLCATLSGHRDHTQRSPAGETSVLKHRQPVGVFPRAYPYTTPLDQPPEDSKAQLAGEQVFVCMLCDFSRAERTDARATVCLPRCSGVCLHLASRCLPRQNDTSIKRKEP